MDPDWTVKISKPRLPLKRFLLMLTLLGLWVHFKAKSVMRFDHLKRKEQRAMQNKEVEEFKGKKVDFILFCPDGKEYEPAPQSY